MSERHGDESGTPPASDPAPDWLLQGPRPNGTAGDTPPGPAAARARERRRNGASLLLPMLVLLIAVIATAPYWAPPLALILPWRGPNGSAPPAQLAEISQRIAAQGQQQQGLDERLARIEDAVKAMAQAPPAPAQPEPQAAAALKALDGRIAALEQRPAATAATPPELTDALTRLDQRMAALEQRPTQPSVDPSRLAAISDDLAKLAAAQTQIDQRIARLETRSTAQPAERADRSLLLALEQLRGELRQGRPFGQDLATIQTLGRGRPELDEAMAPLAAAAQGVPDMATLSRRLELEVAPAVLRAEAAGQAAGWGQWVWAKLGSRVVILRVGREGVKADDPAEASLARAEAALAGNDLAGAVTAIEALPANAAAPAQTWLGAARQRLAAERAVAVLTAHLTQRLTAPAEGEPAAEH